MCGCAGQDLEVVPGAILFILVNKSMNKRLSAISFALSLFLLLVHFKLEVTNPTISYHHEVPGYLVCQTPPPSLQLPVSTKSRTGLRFREGEEDTVPHGRCSMPVRVPYGIGGYSVTVIPSLSNFHT